MTISSYIRNHPILSRFDFEVVYETIFALIQDGRMDWPIDNV